MTHHQRTVEDDETAEAADADLLTAARAGDSEAIRALWVRHYPAAQRAARALTRQAADADDVAADAFARCVQLIADGAGPHTAFRAYLIAAVRSGVIDRSRAARNRDVLVEDYTEWDSPAGDRLDPVHSRAELAYIREAFESLPERWQSVLWQTAVDHESLGTVGDTFGIKPNAATALAKRAREALSAAYLSAHLHGGVRAESCVPFIPLLPQWVRGRAHRRSLATAQQHLQGCSDCQTRVLELSAINRDLSAVLAPAILGPAALGLWRAPVGGLLHHAWSGKAVALKAGTVVVVAITAVAAVALWPHDHHSPPVATAVTPTSAAPQTTTVAPAPTPVPTPTPTPTPTPARPSTDAPLTRPATRSPTAPASTPPLVGTPPPAPRPLVVSVSVSGPADATALVIDVSSGNLSGPLTLELSFPAGVTVSDTNGSWPDCGSTTAITCSIDIDASVAQSWSETLITSWSAQSSGQVGAVVSGRSLAGRTVTGSAAIAWPPTTG